jgi:hypothetical protein
MLFRQADCVRRIAPRNGESTLEILEPVCTVYANPLERVMFHPLRDANPFFHFFEALWILSGANDVSWIEQFLPRMAEYSDDGKVFHGAYGQRMRAVVEKDAQVDQLLTVIETLKANHDTRRAVVALWQPLDDAGYDGKDMPCNCTVTFKVRDGKLNMHVFNRSNDMLWGAYGANVVQFSTIMEFVAAMVGVPVGTYYHTTDCLHVYENPLWQRCRHVQLNEVDPYQEALLWPVLDEDQPFGQVKPYPLVSHPESFDIELKHFVNYAYSAVRMGQYVQNMEYENTYFDNVATPLLNTFIAHKLGRKAVAEDRLTHCQASDWQLAARLWLARREEIKIERAA